MVFQERVTHLLSIPEHILWHLRGLQGLRGLAHGPADNALQFLGVSTRSAWTQLARRIWSTEDGPRYL